ATERDAEPEVVGDQVRQEELERAGDAAQQVQQEPDNDEAGAARSGGDGREALHAVPFGLAHGWQGRRQGWASSLAVSRSPNAFRARNGKRVCSLLRDFPFGLLTLLFR